MNLDPTTTKYLIQAKMEADGIVEKPDVVGAIFGQTEGLLGDELDLRDLQKGGRIGRIEVEVSSKRGRSEGTVSIPSSLDQVETAILASSLETIDRVGPCKARIAVQSVTDVRLTKRQKIVERAKEILTKLVEESKSTGLDLTKSVRSAVQIEEVITYGQERLPAGPNVPDSDAIIVVEGRSDVLNLLRSGVKNAIAAEGTNIPKTIQDLSKERVLTAFVDGDRGGELILRELLQVAEVDFIARAPRGREVEELTQKQITKGLRHKIPAEQYVEMYGLAGVKKKSRDRAPAKITRKAVPAASEPEKTLTPKLQKFRDMLIALSGSSKARLLDEDNRIKNEIPVRDLVDSLKSSDGPLSAVVFDGIITQRILDIAADRGINSVVGSKLGNVTKQPTAIEIWTRKDFEG
ncbi:MAG: DNA primase [Candidatus Thermoplasmatota archaeon]|nr:DNA primase [Candidatus Thermoplasmatota archaeon]